MGGAALVFVCAPTLRPLRADCVFGVARIAVVRLPGVVSVRCRARLSDVVRVSCWRAWWRFVRVCRFGVFLRHHGCCITLFIGGVAACWTVVK